MERRLMPTEPLVTLEGFITICNKYIESMQNDPTNHGLWSNIYSNLINHRINRAQPGWQIAHKTIIKLGNTHYPVCPNKNAHPGY